jgi:hypothetical protein
MLVYASDGVVYTLRFGEVLYGSGLAVSAGAESGEESKTGAAESRYLFITTSFDLSAIPEPPKASDMSFMNKPDSLLTGTEREQRGIHTEHERWQRRIDEGKKKSDELNARFADWYYVISAASFDKLHLNRKDLVVGKKVQKAQPDSSG